MPKKGLTSSEWRERLHKYAVLNLDVVRGQLVNTVWAKELEMINKCPKHRIFNFNV